MSNAFYRDVLGAELIDRGHGTWAYRFGSEQLNVHGPGAIGDPVAQIPVAPGNSDLCFEWDGPIKDAVAHLRRCGVAIEVGPADRSGARGRWTSVYFRRSRRQSPGVHLLPRLSIKHAKPRAARQSLPLSRRTSGVAGTAALVDRRRRAELSGPRFAARDTALDSSTEQSQG